MPKRLTDTDKWKDEWFLSLPNDYKIVWQYLLDNCNHAGVFKKGFDLLNFCCKTNLKEKELKEIFNGRLIDCKNFYFIPKFLLFQYGDSITSNRPVILSVKKELEAKGLTQYLDHLNDIDYDEPVKKVKVQAGVVRSIRPTFEQVEKYCLERKSSIKARTFFDYYESSGWIKSNGQKVVDWKATIRTWENKEKLKHGAVVQPKINPEYLSHKQLSKEEEANAEKNRKKFAELAKGVL